MISLFTLFSSAPIKLPSKFAPDMPPLVNDNFNLEAPENTQNILNTKNSLMILFAISIAFMGYFYFNSINLENMEIHSNLIPTTSSSILTCEQAQKILKDTMNTTDATSNLSHLFQVLKQHNLLTCDRFLPWNDSFGGFTGYIDGIRPENVQQPIMWGFDTLQRIFVTIKHTCTNNGLVSDTITTIFQRHFNNDSIIASARNLECLSSITPLNSLINKILSHVT